MLGIAVFAVSRLLTAQCCSGVCFALYFGMSPSAAVQQTRSVATLAAHVGFLLAALPHSLSSPPPENLLWNPCLSVSFMYSAEHAKTKV